MTRKRLAAGEDPATTVPLSTEPERYALYLQCRDFTKVARAAGVTRQSISDQARVHAWRERALEHDRQLGLTRRASASAKTIATLDAIEDAVIDDEVQKLREGGDEDVDPLHRAAGIVQVVERVHKVRGEAFEQLPPEKEAELHLKVLTDPQFGLYRALESALEQLNAGAKAGRPFEIAPDSPAGRFLAFLAPRVSAESDGRNP